MSTASRQRQDTSTVGTLGSAGRYWRGPLTPGEYALVAVVLLALVHHVDHVLRADNSGWPFTPDVTPFTLSLIVYPIFVADFLFLRERPRLRIGLVAVLFVALQVAHAVFEPPSAQYGVWADGVSRVPHALGKPNLLGVESFAFGLASVAVSTLLAAAVLVALVLLVREHRSRPSTGRTAAGDRSSIAARTRRGEQHAA